MWAKFFASALNGANHPGFPTYPWTFGTWKGKMQQASPSPSASGSPSPSPSATKTIKPTVKPTPKPTPTVTPTKPVNPTPTITPTVTPTGKKAAAAGTRTTTVAATGDGTTGLVGALGSWLSGVFRL
jgi:hypothetical protein